MKIQAQQKQILRDLKRGWKINPIGALRNYGCFRLSARIHALREAGHEISTTLIEIDGHKVAQYRLAKSA
jgi:hypothetical protein